jgi:hypothetical protein
MIEIREAFPLWIWLTFGVFGMVIFFIFLNIILYIINISKQNKKYWLSLKWFLIGFISIFSSKWMMCGLGYPGFTASNHPTFFNLTTARETALLTSVISMTFSLISWICFLIGVKKLYTIFR